MLITKQGRLRAALDSVWEMKIRLKPSLRAAARPPNSVGYNSFVRLTSVDWLVVALYFLFNLAIGFYYKSRAGANVNSRWGAVRFSKKSAC